MSSDDEMSFKTFDLSKPASTEKISNLFDSQVAKIKEMGNTQNKKEVNEFQIAAS